MAFSGALTLTDLNDFITPSQACIKPVEQLNSPNDSVAKEAGSASTEIRIDINGLYYEVSKDKSQDVDRTKLQQAQISLNDCLACSGCITSAESVLITLQSHTEVLNFLHSNADSESPGHKIPILSISPQSLASLAASVSSTSCASVTIDEILHRVEMFCTQTLTFERVFDTSFARHVALLEHSREFMERKQGAGRLPMLASACPGWICYAEKAHPEMLSFIATTKSPQQVMGTLVKYWMAKKWNKRPDEIYHVTVMPCYDKKLEASRQDFYNEVYATRDVDCVITTGELELMMREKGWDLSKPTNPNKPFPESSLLADPILPPLIPHKGSSSGSYLHSVINAVTAAYVEPLDLSVRAVHTSDYEEYTLRKRGSDDVVFKGAKCYGFRNLQNVVRKVGREAGVQVGKGAAGRLGGGLRARARRGKGKDVGGEEDRGYDYVEVMACPSGCVNGGGQLKPPVKLEDEEGYKRAWQEEGVRTGEGGLKNGLMQNAKWGNKEWTKRVEDAYWHDLPTPAPSPKPCYEGHSKTDVLMNADRMALRVLHDACQPCSRDDHTSWEKPMDDEAEARRRDLFRTQYRAVESEVIGLAVKW